MRSFFENKRLVLLLAVLALGALTVLAISLNQVPFREGQHFGQKESAHFEPYVGDVGEIWADVPIWKHVLLWSMLSLMAVLIGLLLSPEARKRLLVMFIRFAFTFWAIYFLLKNYGDLLLNFNRGEGGADLAGQESGGPIPVFEPSQISPTFSYLISFGFILLWLLVLWALHRGWRRYQLGHTRKPLEELARIARSSLDDLSSGRNSSDVIINCYLRMSDVVSSKRQLQREVAMTPHEFALRLEQAGLPGDAVTRLTRLFEGVRYGDRRSGPKDVNEAVSCLKTILHYCGESV
jgi:Domain of unknown function (DUF4129)